jgi:hypothetical protein
VTLQGFRASFCLQEAHYVFQRAISRIIRKSTRDTRAPLLRWVWVVLGVGAIRMARSGTEQKGHVEAD